MKTFLKQNWLKCVIILSLGFVILPSFSLAHPGRTAADECHYCRTNCDYWGVPWNTRHCHGSSAPSTSVPTPTPTPTPPPAPTPPKIVPVIPITEQEIVNANVVRVIDGDTIEVKFENGSLEKVRLIGIDTPETKDPRKPVECFGQEATKKMEELVNGKVVKLDRKKEENRDTYDRLLRFVYVGNTFVNAEMIKQGYAYAYLKYPFDSKLMDDFKNYEKEARENERGLWAPGVCLIAGVEATAEEKPQPDIKGAQTADIGELTTEEKASKKDIITALGILILLGTAIYYSIKKTTQGLKVKTLNKNSEEKTNIEVN